MNEEEKIKKLAKEVGIDNIDETIKIGSKEEASWKMTLQNIDSSIENAKKTIELNEYLRPYVLKKIENERRKWLREAEKNKSN